MDDHEENVDEFSPPLEEGMRRADSDRSWSSSQEISQDETSINKDQLFLVSLGTIMALFTYVNIKIFKAPVPYPTIPSRDAVKCYSTVNVFLLRPEKQFYHSRNINISIANLIAWMDILFSSLSVSGSVFEMQIRIYLLEKLH
jgi:hypothetical protein